MGSRRAGVIRAFSWFAGAYATVLALYSRPISDRIESLHAWWWRGDPAWPTAHLVLDRAGHAVMTVAQTSTFALLGATALTALGFALRTVLRARQRAGHGDAPLGARAWASAHPRWVRFLTALPPAALVVLTMTASDDWARDTDTSLTRVGLAALWAIPAVFAALGWTAVTRAGVRAMLAPTVDDAAPPTVASGGDEITFDAVAVTKESRAAVGALVAVTVAMVGWMATLPPRLLFHEPYVLASLAAYVAAAAFGAALFRRVSRVSMASTASS